MYAVIATGGKQYKIAEGDIVKVEKLSGEVGNKVVLQEVLMVGSDAGHKVGRPRLDGASVEAEIVDQSRHRKIIVFKFKVRKKYRKKAGHRQPFTALKINKINS